MFTDLFSGFDDQNFNEFSSWVVLVVDFLVLRLFLGCLFFHSSLVRVLGVIFWVKGLAWNLVRLSEGVWLGGFSLRVVSLFLFLFFNNLAGLFPYVFSWTSQVSLSLRVSVPFWLRLFASGVLWHGGVVLAHWLPVGSRLPLSVVLVLGETIRTFLRPFSLSLRLAVNITAGHVFVRLLSKGLVIRFVWGLGAPLFVCGVVLFGLLVAEGAVCLIQAIVFVLLLTLYRNEHPKASSRREGGGRVRLFVVEGVYPFLKKVLKKVFDKLLGL